MSQTMAARVLVVGNSEEGTGPALSLSVVRVAEFSQEETPLLQVRFFGQEVVTSCPSLKMVIAGDSFVFADDSRWWGAPISH